MQFEELLRKYDVPIPLPFWNVDEFNLNRWLDSVRTLSYQVTLIPLFCFTACSYIALATNKSNNAIPADL